MQEVPVGDFWKYGIFPSNAVDTRNRDRLLLATMPSRQKHKYEGAGMHI